MLVENHHIAALGTHQLQDLTPEQVKQLLNASAGHRLHAFFVVGLMLGLRPAELRGLTWADIDFEAGTLRVSGIELGGRRVDEVKVNHERAKRTLVMPAAMVEALRQHRRQWELERAMASIGMRTPPAPSRAPCQGARERNGQPAAGLQTALLRPG